MSFDVVLQIIEIALLVVCITASAFFSSAEMSLFSLSRAKILSYKGVPSIRERRIYDLMHNFHLTLICIILCNMFVNSWISMLSDDFIARLALSPVATTMVSAFTGVVILLFFGEISPMSAAYAHCETWSKVVSVPIYAIRRVLSPLLKLVGALCDKVLNLIGRTQNEPLSRDEYLSYLDTCVHGKAFSAREAKLLREIFAMNDRIVRQCMHSRVDMTFISSAFSPDEVAKAIRESRQAFLPVSDSFPDASDRLLSSRAFFELAPAERAEWSSSSAVQRAEFLPATVSIPKALVFFRETRCDAVLVADEYGGILGMLTLQDIYSELAGPAVGMGTPVEQMHAQTAENSWILDGTAAPEFVRIHSGWTTCNLDNHYKSATLSGIFCEELGRLPNPNETVRADGVDLKALVISRNRVAKVKISIPDSLRQESSVPMKEDFE